MSEIRAILCTYVPASVAQRIKKLARELNTSNSRVLEYLITRYVGELEKEIDALEEWLRTQHVRKRKTRERKKKKEDRPLLV